MSIKLFLLCIMLVLVGNTGSFAQGFQAQPLHLHFIVYPGSRTEKSFTVQNASATTRTPVNFTPVRVWQTPDGAPTFAEPVDYDKMKSPPSGLRSCLEWFAVDTKSTVLAPAGAKTVTVRMVTPPGARGFYAGGILVHGEPPKTPNHGVGVIMQFLVLVTVQVQGPAAKEQLKLEHLDMQLVPIPGSDRTTTRVAVQINNSGETRSIISGTLSVLVPAGKEWRRVTETSLSDTSIWPGTQVSVYSDIGRMLPTGHYKLSANIQWNGRKGGSMQDEVDFQGDPRVQTVVSDASLMVMPVDITATLLPRASRSVILTVQNPTQEILKVSCRPDGPRSTAPATGNEITADAFSCASWVRISPESFTLRGGEERRVRIIFQVPENETILPNHYGWIDLNATYQDGQSAGGVQRVPIWIQHPRLKSVKRADAVSLLLDNDENNRYVVSALFQNTGTIHFSPHARTAVVGGFGRTVLDMALELDSERVLPQSVVRGSGVIDFTAVPSGFYQFTVLMDYDGELVKKTLPIRVEEQKGKKIVSVVEEQAEEKGRMQNTKPKK